MTKEELLKRMEIGEELFRNGEDHPDPVTARIDFLGWRVAKKVRIDKPYLLGQIGLVRNPE